MRSIARRVLGVTRTSTCYLPWLTLPGLERVVRSNNIESRFTSWRDASELQRACASGAWSPPDKVRTGKLCTGCQGDLLYCLRQLGVRSPA